MSDKIKTVIEELPEELRPLASSIMDSVASGLLDDTEAFVECILSEGYNSAHEQRIATIPTPQLISMLDQINLYMSKQTEDYRERVSEARLFFQQLLLLAFSALRKEIVS